MKTFTPTQDQITAATNVFMAMAFEETIRPIVEDYQKAILAKHQFKVCDDFNNGKEEIILDPKHSYLMSNSDFAIYHAETKRARDAAKLHVENDDFCPLLVAEHMTVLAKHALIETMESVTGLSLEHVTKNLDTYRRYVDLTLKLLAPFVENPLAA